MTEKNFSKAKHSRLAMAAAKRMATTTRKAATLRTFFYHLRASI